MSAESARLPRKRRPIRIEGDLAYITLTKGRVAVIDAADVLLVGEWAWHAVIGRKGHCYAQRSWMRGNARGVILMHRLIACAAPEEDVDHKDGDGLNNRRANLRRCTTSQNMGNRGAARGSRLGVKGVMPCGNKFVAHISAGGRTCHLGTFRTVEEARAAYARAAVAAFGEFARVE